MRSASYSSAGRVRVLSSTTTKERAQRSTPASSGVGIICLTSHMNLAYAPFRIAEDPSQSDLVAKYFRALGDPTRLRILELLDAEGELPVGDLVERLDVAQPKVSKHLACLRWCGFVASEREHRTVRYRIADERISEVIELGRALLADNAEHVAACRLVGRGC
jgi:DNA-binding transcriptional ArsR family regulator